MRATTLILTAATALASCGCTHNQLRRSAVGQVGTVADIYQQQVLNNLAKFASDPNALPDFGVPTGGLATVSDTAGATTPLGWSNTALNSVGLTINTSRNINQNWSLKPVQDPRKLELMRCAYRNAVGFAGCDNCCPDCQKRFANFYTGNPCGTVPTPCQECPGAECKDAEGDLKKQCDAKAADTGVVNSHCLGSCWFHVGCSNCLKRIQKENPCCLIGVHCDTVVWVTPGRGTDELSKLTIAILDFAVNDPKKPSPPKTKEVIGYFDPLGNPATRDTASYRVKAVLTATEQKEDYTAETSMATAESLRKLLLGKPAKASDLQSLPDPVEAVGPAPTEATPEKTPSDIQLDLLQLQPQA